MCYFHIITKVGDTRIKNSYSLLFVIVMIVKTSVLRGGTIENFACWWDDCEDDLESMMEIFLTYLQKIRKWMMYSSDSLNPSQLQQCLLYPH